MSRLLFKMRHVPEDEAEDIRQLLSRHNIEFFETFAGNWSISVPALWLKYDEQFETARNLIDDYQNKRTNRIRNEFHETKTMWQVFLESPTRFCVYIAAIAIVLYISLQFFISF